MAMPPPAVVAAQIAQDLQISGANESTVAIAHLTALVTRIQAMVMAGTVTVTVTGTAAAVTPGPGTAVVTGTATGTLT